MARWQRALSTANIITEEGGRYLQRLVELTPLFFCMSTCWTEAKAITSWTEVAAGM